MTVDIKRDDVFDQIPVLSPEPSSPKQRQLWSEARAYFVTQLGEIDRLPDREEAGRRHAGLLHSFADFCSKQGLRGEVRWSPSWEEDGP